MLLIAQMMQDKTQCTNFLLERLYFLNHSGMLVYNSGIHFSKTAKIVLKSISRLFFKRKSQFAIVDLLK